MDKGRKELSGLGGEAKAGEESPQALNDLAERVLAGGEAAGPARRDLQQLLGFDDINFDYFLIHLRNFRRGTEAGASEELELAEPGRDPRGRTVAHSTASAPPELMAHLPWVPKESLADSRYETVARDSIVWIKKMQAGTGSSMERTRYLAERLGVPADQVSLGAKGTDLFLDLKVGSDSARQVSLAEVQILQGIRDVERGEFGGVVFHDIVGPETRQAVEKIWETPCPLRPERTYGEYVAQADRLSRSGSTFQAHLPTVDAEGRLTYARHAPGGHGLFGVAEAVAAARGQVPDTAGRPLVSVIGNGEDLSSTPDPGMVGWMVENHIPIAMVTTTKTAIDEKGGQIALVTPPSGTVYVTIVEAAQAEASGQEALFKALGLREGDGIALFNTNMALFNHQALGPKLAALWKDAGEEEFFRIVAPDLIRNRKQQRDPDGQVRQYTQLEGAMGSVLLNLDRYWRCTYGEPLVHFINVGPSERTDFFSPIKKAFDFFMQFHSDRFRFNEETMRPENQRPGALPAISLKGSPSRPKFYEEVTQVLEAFRGTGIREMDRLKIEGNVLLAETVLWGEVEILSRMPGTVDLAERLREDPDWPRQDGRPLLRNIRIEITAEGGVTPHPLS